MIESYLGGIKIKKSTLINIFNIFVLINYSSGIINLYKVGLGLINSFFQSITYLAYLFSFLFLIGRFYARKHRFIKNSKIPLIWSFLIIIFSSIVANNDIFVIGKSVGLFCTIIYAIYLIEYYKFDKLIKIIYKSQVIVLIITLVFIKVFPQQATMYYSGEYVIRGAFIHKNLLAANMAFGILISLAYRKIEKNTFNKRLAIINIIISVILIIKSDSMTSIIILLLSVGLGYIYKKKLLRINPALLMIYFHMLIYYFVFYGEKIQIVFNKILGRDMSLTGRNNIWKSAFNVIIGNTDITYNPVMGYGFSNVWRDNSEISNYMRYNTFGELTGAHNGFLEWGLEIGVILTLLLIIMLIISGYKAIKIGKFNKDIMCFFIQYIVYIMVFYISEHSTNPLNYQILMMFLVIIGSNKYYFSQKDILNINK